MNYNLRHQETTSHMAAIKEKKFFSFSKLCTSEDSIRNYKEISGSSQIQADWN